MIPQTSTNVKWRSYSAAELDAATFTLDYLVPGVLVARQPMILAGPRKSLKTTLALDLGLALATGRRFLGRFKVARTARVGFTSGESGMGTIQETARRIANQKGFRLGEVGDRLLLTEHLPQFDSSADLHTFEAWIRQHRLQVVIIDPAYLCMPGDGASNLFIMGRLLGKVCRVFSSTGATMVLVHHTRKGIRENRNPYAPPDLEDIAWAGFQEFARQWLLVGRREAYQPGSGTHRLWLHVGGSAGHGGLWAVDADEGPYSPDSSRTWGVTVRTASQLKQAEREEKRAAQEAEDRNRLDADAHKVLAALDRSPDGDTKRGVRAASGLPTKRFDQALEALRDSGRVVDCTITKSNRQSYDGIKLADKGCPTWVAQSA